MTAPLVEPDSQVYAMLAGPIDQQTVIRVCAAIATATANKIGHLHLMFQSFGGVVGDGICLYNLFRTLPFGLTLYNSGSIQSIGTVAYLGAQERKTSAHATFMIHKTSAPNQPTTARSAKALAESLILDDERTEAILRSHLKLSTEQWTHIEHHDLYLTATQAIDVGLAHAEGEFTPPTGTQVFNI